jgi:hypothetical protein
MAKKILRMQDNMFCYAFEGCVPSRNTGGGGGGCGGVSDDSDDNNLFQFLEFLKLCSS